MEGNICEWQYSLEVERSNFKNISQHLENYPGQDLNRWPWIRAPLSYADDIQTDKICSPVLIIRSWTHQFYQCKHLKLHHSTDMIFCLKYYILCWWRSKLKKISQKSGKYLGQDSNLLLGLYTKMHYHWSTKKISTLAQFNQLLLSSDVQLGRFTDEDTLRMKLYYSTDVIFQPEILYSLLIKVKV